MREFDGRLDAAERHTLVQCHVVADLGGFADHDARPVIDDEAAADVRSRMYLDAGQQSSEIVKSSERSARSGGARKRGSL